MKAALLTWTVVAAGAASLAAGAAVAPDALRRVDEFRVTGVHVHGVIHLEPADVLTASGITSNSSVFDDARPWRIALLAHPLVRSVRIERELPGTIRLLIEETEPLAFARIPELRPVDARGYLLPMRSLAGLDLPVLAATARVATLATGAVGATTGYQRIIDEPSLRALRTIDVIHRLEPELATAISEAAPLAAGDIRLTLRSPRGAELLLPAVPDAERLRAVRVTLAHLHARPAEFGARGPVRIDARFFEQVVVQPMMARLSTTTTNSGGAR